MSQKWTVLKSASTYVTLSGSATPNYVLLFDSSGNAIARQPRGNTTVVQMADSTTNPTTGHVAVFDASGNVKDGGVLPATATAVTHQFVTAYNSTTGAFTLAQPAESDLSLTDITTNNVSITKHGFCPKAPNDSTQFLNGTGAWSVPATVTLKTNGTTNSSQTALNLAAGTNITLAESSGTVTITSSGGSGVTLQTNGTNNSTQSTLNLAAGSNVTLTESSGTVTIASSGGGGGSSLGLTGALTASPPDPSTFTLFGSNSAGTTTNYSSGQYFSIITPVSGSSADYYKSLPSAPWTIYCVVMSGADTTTGTDFKVGLWDSSENVVRSQRMTMVSGGWRWGVASAGSDLATLGGSSTDYRTPLVWMLRMKNDNTNVTYSWSTDGGFNWYQLYSEAKSNISAATRYGFHLANVSTTKLFSATFLSFYVTTP